MYIFDVPSWPLNHMSAMYTYEEQRSGSPRIRKTSQGLQQHLLYILTDWKGPTCPTTYMKEISRGDEPILDNSLKCRSALTPSCRRERLFGNVNVDNGTDARLYASDRFEQC